MNDVERKFLLAVERGDVGKVKSLLSSQDRRLDINCCDPLARNSLVIAIDNENLEMVKILLEANVEIGDSLLYAIKENFVEAVELLLDHEESASESHNGMKSWEKNRENSTFSADMTPLILAAHQNNFEIIKILLDRQVSPIPDPHDPRCHCNACCLARADDCLKHSRARINAYRALASPCLMALSSPDPLLSAFEMSAKLESLSKMEPEYKQDYLKLRAQCQTFATQLLDYTRTSKELEILLNYSDEYLDDHDHSGEAENIVCCQGGLYETSIRTASTSLDTTRASNTSVMPDSYSHHKYLESSQSTLRTSKKDSILSLDSVTGKHESYKSHMRLARLSLAIQCKQKTFCAHPNIQELLATMWYENLPGFRRKNPIAQSIQIILIGLMFPIYSIAYLVAPHSQLGRYIKKPFIKFICHSASYMTFLVVLILASQRVEAFYSWDTILSLFKEDSKQRRWEQYFNTSKIKPVSTDLDEAELREFAEAWFRYQGASVSQSSARGLDGFTKIFEQLPPSAKRRGALPSPIELVILVWVISLIWAEIKQIKSLGLRYYKADMWNALDSVASGFYVGTIILRLVSFFQADELSTEVAREHWHAYDPILLSEGLFAAATIFSALKLVYIFSVNPYLGPLQISLGRMILDILRFSWIYMLVLFSFACGMNQLLWYYADLERHQCLNVTNYNLAQYYSAQYEINKRKIENLHEFSSKSNCSHLGPECSNHSNVEVTTESNVTMNVTMPPLLNGEKNMTDDNLMEAAFSASLQDDSEKPPITIDDSCKTWRYFSNVFESSQTLFWATFGLVDLENFDLTGIRQYTRFWALLMFGIYCFINVIVVLNLLIAMMNHSYVKISKKSDIEWKFARTRLWMSYFDTGSTVPAPFNIVPSVKSFTYLTRNVVRQLRNLFRYLYDLIRDIPSMTLKGSRENRRRSYTPKKVSSIKMSTLDSQDRLPDLMHSVTDVKPESLRKKARSKRNCTLTATYRNVIRSLVRRYLVNEQRAIERKCELTEAKLNRWSKLNAFEM